MSSCSIIIKIKDYFPKIDSIPYQNFICLFTNGENEGQIPLISKDDETYKHQMKNVLSDIKYKIHVLDYNDMSLIGMCEMVISYDILSQIAPPNGFIQEQQKKLLMDTNTKRKLFGTVLNMGDIYLNIYSEIYLLETKINNNINTKPTNRKKAWGFEAGQKNRLDGSPRTVHKKQIMMQINSDRRALININKNSNLNIEKKQKYKNITSNGKNEKNMSNINNIANNYNNNFNPNSSFNYRDIISQPKENNNINNNKNNNEYKKINNNIKNKNILKNAKKQNIIKNNPNFQNNNKDKEKEKDKENNLFNYNIYSRYKTESNKNNKNSNLKSKINKIDKKQKNKDNNHPLINSISPKLSSGNFTEKEGTPFSNNTGNKITTIESLENIDFSCRKYITKTKDKKNNAQSNITGYGNSTLFSTTSTEQAFNDMDKIILEKGTEIRNDFSAQLKYNKKISLNNNINNINLNSNNNTNNSNSNNFDTPSNDYIIKTQTEIKNNFLKLIEFYTLLSQKLLKIRDKNDISFQKNLIFKEKLFNELKKNNALTQKKTVAEVENFMNINNHGSLNEKFLRPLIKLKKLEFKIFQNIFNVFYYEYDILKFKEFENNKRMDENVKIELLLMVFKNLVKNYGNISQIYLSDNNKKTQLKNCFNKFGIEEKENGDWGLGPNFENMDNNPHNKEQFMEKNKNIEKKENKNDIDKFKVIKEVDEEKEEEFDEEDKLNLGNSDIISNHQISYSNSNTKDNLDLYSNEKYKSDNKNGKSFSGQKKLFDNNQNLSANKKENKLDKMKYNLSKKIMEQDFTNSNKKENQNENNIKESEENDNIENINKNNIFNEKNKKDISTENNTKLKEITEEPKEDNNLIIAKKLDNENNMNNNINKEENEEEKEIINNTKEIIDNKKKEEVPRPPTKREIYTRKNRQKYKQKNSEQALTQENNNSNNDNKADNNKNTIKKEYDEEDLIMQKMLIEEFPKKCKEENRFIRLSKYEYSFGDEKIKVIYKDGEVVLKLDEGDYKLQEFINILNEGKNEEEINNENKIIKNNEEKKEKEKINEKESIKEDDKSEQINSNQKEINEINNNCDSGKKEITKEKINNNSSSSEKKYKKRRKKRVSEDSSSFDKETQEKEENKKEEKKEIIIDKEMENTFNSDISDAIKISNTEGNESDVNSENKGRRYVIKRRRDYMQKKLK